MNRSETTSIRLPPRLRQQLEQASHVLHRGKNWIIVQALQLYINQTLNTQLIEEARQQSLRANKADKPEDASWEDEMDDSAWR